MTAPIAAIAMALAFAGSVKAATVSVDFECTSSEAYEYLQAALYAGDGAVFQERLSKAVKSGDCRIVRSRPAAARQARLFQGTLSPLDDPFRPRR
jgi:hypothetical protein